ncbi:MAG: DUF4416 family protein [Sedimentisphaerales bacterium]|nr:DUF4416 family protein [Sedimentisphaerales bacterium]
MWETNEPKPVKLIIGILAANDDALSQAVKTIESEFGTIDLKSQVWPFTQTDYYKDELGQNVLRQLVTIEKLIDPAHLADIKHKTNKIEKALAENLNLDLPRPVNLDPGIIEPSKLILASTKNFSHRIYIGNKIYAELTLSFIKGVWKSFDYTFPDYKENRYHDFLSKVRNRLVEQLRAI